VRFDESLLEAAKEALGRQVKVSGTRRRDTARRGTPRLYVFRLEVIEEESA